jgi:hypothetical protein
MFINCPHCDLLLEILELNCKKFVCGVYRTDFIQIPPHLSKEECVRLMESRLIWGCGKPFILVQHNEKWTAVESEYG